MPSRPASLSLLLGVLCALAVVCAAPPAGAAPLHPDTVTRLARLGRDGPPPEPVPVRPAGIAGEAGTFGRAWTGHPRILVLLVDFDDRPADRELHDPAAVERFLFSLGETEFGSLREYYREASYGRMDVTGEVKGWFRMPGRYRDYAGDYSGLCNACFPDNARGLAAHAVEAAVAGGVDFSRFDDDGPDGVPGSGDDDGILDGLLIGFSGVGAERSGMNTDLRSHYWDMTAMEEAGGIRIPDYALFPVGENVGVAVHEFGHVLGGEDLYDTSGRAAGLGIYSVMAGGMWIRNGTRPGGPDPYTRIEWGFATPEIPGANEPSLDLDPVNDGPSVLRLWTGGREGREYFLVENRRDRGIDEYLPGHGILVYHVDRSVAGQNNSGRYRVGVVQADGRYQLEGIGPGNSGDSADFLPGTADVRRLDDGTVPDLRSHDGEPTRVAVEVLEEEGETMRLAVEVGVDVGSAPEPRLELLPESDALGAGIESRGTQRLRVRIANAGSRLKAGTLSLSSSDPRVSLPGLPASIPVPGVPPLGSRELVDPVDVFLRPGEGGAGSEPMVLRGRLVSGGRSRDLLAALPLSRDVVAVEGFEKETALVGAAPQGGFRRTDRRAREGKWSWWTGGYDARVVWDLEIGPYSIGESAEVRFWQWVDTQAYGEWSHDGGFLEVSTDGGRSWTRLIPEGGYPAAFTNTAGNPYPLIGNWAGRRRMWEQVRVPVVGHAGHARFRFRFVSDFTASLGFFEGWYLDAFELRAWEPGRMGEVEAVESGTGNLEIAARLLPVAPSPVPDRVTLVRSREGRVLTLAEWPGASPFEKLLSIADADPSRTDRYWIEWEEGGVRRSPELVLAARTPPEHLLDPAPAALRISGGGWIRFWVPGEEPVPVRLRLFDVRGSLVSRLVEETMVPGSHRVSLPARGASGRGVPAGAYFLRLDAGTRSASRRLVLLP